MRTLEVQRASQDMTGIAIASLPLLSSALALVLATTAPIVWTMLIALCAALCSVYVLLNLQACTRQLTLVMPLLLLGACYLFDFVLDPSADGFRHLVALLAVSVIILFYLSFGAAFLANPRFRSILTAEAVMIIGAGALQLNQKNYDIGSIFYGACLLFYLHLYKKYDNRFVAAVMLLLFCWVAALVTNFRALLYLSLHAVGLYLFMNMFRFTKFRSYSIFAILMIGMSAFFYVYLHMDDFELTRNLNLMAQDVSGRQLASGRQILWPAILELAMASPWVGLGGDALPKALMDTGFSSHNYYLQLFLQKGFLGLFFLMWFLIQYWQQFHKTMWTSASINFAAAIFLTLLLHNLTEVVMFQNALMVALPAWVIIALGVSQAMNAEPRGLVRR